MMPDKTTDDLTHCLEMMKWAEDHPTPGCYLVDICWLDWATEYRLLLEKEAQ